jgi:hypothetical protein
LAKTGGCLPMWMWCSTPWEGVGTTSPEFDLRRHGLGMG